MHYLSHLPYHTERMHAAAVYCSDGRVCEQYDDFLQNGLNLPRYDRVAMPGGPGCLLGDGQAQPGQAVVLEELKFLVEAHGLNRVVLIQHEDCAYYTQFLGVPPVSAEQIQKDDLVLAADMIRRTLNIDVIEGYFARRTVDGVRFEPVPID